MGQRSVRSLGDFGTARTCSRWGLRPSMVGRVGPQPLVMMRTLGFLLRDRAESGRIGDSVADSGVANQATLTGGGEPRGAESLVSDGPGQRAWPGLRLIGAGFGRTGTMSLKFALEILGIGPCYHMTEVARNPGHPELWRRVSRGFPVDWHTLFAHYRAAVDWPACHYYSELMKVFPAAKVVLTVRDPGQWYTSMESTLYWLQRVADQGQLPWSKQSLHEARDDWNGIWTATFGGRFHDRAHAINTYLDHNAQVVEVVPPDRLLVYDVANGWPPLCEFVRMSVPNLPFPKLNDRSAFRAYNRRYLDRLSRSKV